MVNKYQSEMKVDSESIFKRLLKDVKFEEMSGFQEFKDETKLMISTGLDSFKKEIEVIKEDVYSMLDNCNRDLHKVNKDNDLLLNKF